MSSPFINCNRKTEILLSKLLHRNYTRILREKYFTQEYKIFYKSFGCIYCNSIRIGNHHFWIELFFFCKECCRTLIPTWGLCNRIFPQSVGMWQYLMMAVIWPKYVVLSDFFLIIKAGLWRTNFVLVPFFDIRQNIPEDLNLQQPDCEDFAVRIIYLAGIFPCISEVYHLTLFQISDNTLMTSEALICKRTICSSPLNSMGLHLHPRTKGLLSIIQSPNKHQKRKFRQTVSACCLIRPNVKLIVNFPAEHLSRFVNTPTLYWECTLHKMNSEILSARTRRL